VFPGLMLVKNGGAVGELRKTDQVLGGSEQNGGRAGAESLGARPGEKKHIASSPGMERTAKLRVYHFRFS
jgi:hypothetical protein